MFYRITKINFDDSRFDEILAWGETQRETIEGIEGLMHVDVFRFKPGEGMIVANYENESAFDAVEDTVMSVLGDMAQFMTSPSHTHAGTVDQSFGR